jgi:hypothetical protein
MGKQQQNQQEFSTHFFNEENSLSKVKETFSFSNNDKLYFCCLERRQKTKNIERRWK